MLIFHYLGDFGQEQLDASAAGSPRCLGFVVLLGVCDRCVPDVASPCSRFLCLGVGLAALMEQCVSPVEVFLFSKASSTLWTHGSVAFKNQALFLGAGRAGVVRDIFSSRDSTI